MPATPAILGTNADESGHSAQRAAMELTLWDPSLSRGWTSVSPNGHAASFAPPMGSCPRGACIRSAVCEVAKVLPKGGEADCRSHNEESEAFERPRGWSKGAAPTMTDLSPCAHVGFGGADRPCAMGVNDDETGRAGGLGRRRPATIRRADASGGQRKRRRTGRRRVTAVGGGRVVGRPRCLCGERTGRRRRSATVAADDGRAGGGRLEEGRRQRADRGANDKRRNGNQPRMAVGNHGMGGGCKRWAGERADRSVAYALASVGRTGAASCRQAAGGNG